MEAEGIACQHTVPSKVSYKIEMITVFIKNLKQNSRQKSVVEYIGSEKPYSYLPCGVAAPCQTNIDNENKLRVEAYLSVSRNFLGLRRP